MRKVERHESVMERQDCRRVERMMQEACRGTMNAGPAYQDGMGARFDDSHGGYRAGYAVNEESGADYRAGDWTRERWSCFGQQDGSVYGVNGEIYVNHEHVGGGLGRSEYRTPVNTSWSGGVTAANPFRYGCSADACTSDERNHWEGRGPAAHQWSVPVAAMRGRQPWEAIPEYTCNGVTTRLVEENGVMVLRSLRRTDPWTTSAAPAGPVFYPSVLDAHSSEVQEVAFRQVGRTNQVEHAPGTIFDRAVMGPSDCSLSMGWHGNSTRALQDLKHVEESLRLSQASTIQRIAPVEMRLERFVGGGGCGTPCPDDSERSEEGAEYDVSFNEGNSDPLDTDLHLQQCAMEEGRRVGEEEAGANDTERVVEPDPDAMPLDIDLHVERLRDAEYDNGCGQVPLKLLDVHTSNDVCKQPDEVSYAERVTHGCDGTRRSQGHCGRNGCAVALEGCRSFSHAGGNAMSGGEQQDDNASGESCISRIRVEQTSSPAASEVDTGPRSISADLAATTEIEVIDLRKSTEEDVVWSEGAPDCVPPERDKHRARLCAFAERYAMLVRLLTLNAALGVRTVRENAVVPGKMPPTVLRVWLSVYAAA